MTKKKVSSKNLITIALNELLHRKKFDDITIIEICNKAHVSRMSFYRYYSSKEDIFIVYADEKFNSFFEKVSKIPDIDIYKFVNMLTNLLHESKRELKILHDCNKFHILIKLFENYTSYLFSQFNTPNIIRLRPNPFAIYFLSGGLFNTISKWAKSEFATAPDILAKSILELLGAN